VRTLVGLLLLLFAAGAGVLGGAWAYMKASGAEVDVCPGRGAGCLSGWYPAGAMLAFALFVAVAGVVLLRGGASLRSSAHRM
jgi:hypothetical protein